MTLNPEQFEKLKTYLLYDKKLSATTHNINSTKSKFLLLTKYFKEREFNRENFVQFVAYMKERGYTNNYINNFIKLAKHIDKFYKINELQDFTYFDKPYGLKPILSPDQIEAMADLVVDYDRDKDEKNIRYRAILLTLFYTGARINEVLSLCWEDLKHESIPYLVMNQTKVKEMRFCPIPKSLYDLLVSLPRYSGYIFSNSNGHPVYRETISEDIKRRAAMVGVKDLSGINNHIMRHSFVNFMLRNKAPLEQVSKIVGHKSIATTQTYYVHLLLEDFNQMLHKHHPGLKKEQTLETIQEMAKEFLNGAIDAERFFLKFARHKKKISLEIHEIE
jgi:integrase